MALIAPRACRVAAGMLALGLCIRPAGAATPEDGRRAYDSGHFTDAMGIWAELSRAGNAEAEFGLGLLYDLGNGRPEDPETAFFWYNAAAGAGMPAAQFNVGAMYDSGRGVAQDHAAAALWYAKAASHGHHRAQFNLGQLYEQGDGVPRNLDAAAAWLKAAADGGLQAAAAQLKTLDRTRSKPGGPLTAVTLVSPARDVTLTTPDNTPMVEFVWLAAPEPKPVHYEVQIRGGSTLQIIPTASVTTTALAVQLPQAADIYVWSVDTVARDGSRSHSDWSWFSVGSPSQSEKSIAAAPSAPHADH